MNLIYIAALTVLLVSGCDSGGNSSEADGLCDEGRCDEELSLPFATEHGTKVVQAVAEAGPKGAVVVHDLAFCSACLSEGTIDLIGTQLFGEGFLGYTKGQYDLAPFVFDNTNALGRPETVPRYDLLALETDLDGLGFLSLEDQALADRMLAEATARTEIADFYTELQKEGFLFYRLSVSEATGTNPLDSAKLLRERFESLLSESTYSNYAYLRLELGIDMLKQEHADIAAYTALEDARTDELVARIQGGIPDKDVPALTRGDETATVPWRPSAPAISVHVCDAINLVWTRNVFSKAYDTGFKAEEMEEFATSAIALKTDTAADCE
jgi:hypothetical protein